MYLYLGQDTLVKTDEIVGVFDLDTTSVSKKTREFLARAQTDGRVVNVTHELPKSFALTAEGTVYVGQLSAQTLRRRLPAENGKKIYFK